MLRFIHARHHILAHNLADIDTRGFRPQQLAKTAFQRALREALDQRPSGGRIHGGM